MRKDAIMWFIIAFSIAFILGFYVTKSRADDYSNDFEERIRLEYDRPDPVRNFDIEESPITKYQRNVQEMEDRKAIDKLNRQIKFTYRPYSLDVKQNRKRLGIDDE